MGISIMILLLWNLPCGLFLGDMDGLMGSYLEKTDIMRPLTVENSKKNDYSIIEINKKIF